MLLGRTYVTHVRMCPKCAAPLDGATEVWLDGEPEERAAPHGGDLTTCVYCASLLLFTDDGALVVTEIPAKMPRDRREQLELLLLAMRANVRRRES